MKPRPTQDQAAASVIIVIDPAGRELYRHADPAGLCVVLDGEHFSRSAAENCARNSLQIAWKRERAAARK